MMVSRIHPRLCLVRPVSGDPREMGQPNNPPATPKDASKATDEQRELQDELDHQDDDPDAPGGHQTHKQVADET
jgi:hypothetical protein